MKGTTVIIIIFSIFHLAGCESFSKRHSTRALLFVEEQPISLVGVNTSPENVVSSPIHPSKKIVGTTYKLPMVQGKKQYFGNPVFIHNNTKFSIRLDEIGAGWLYRELGTAESRQAHQNENFYLPNVDRHPISRNDFHHFRGRELWLLATISSLNSNDPLETKSKRYFKASNVKFDAQSYALLPLDADEKFIFTHESDMSYRVKLQLYSINNFELKKELAKISKNPGLIGVGEAILSTLKNTVGSIAGDLIESTWNDKIDEGLALERFLLSIDAIEEFNGEILVLRANDFNHRKTDIAFSKETLQSIRENIEDENAKKTLNDIIENDKDGIYYFPSPVVETSYILLDYFKKNPVPECAYSQGSDSWKSNFNAYIDLEIAADEVIEINKESCDETQGSKSMSSTSATAPTKYNSKLDNSLNKYSYIKFSTIQSHSAKSFVEQAGTGFSAMNVSSYTNSLDLLLAAIEKSKIKKLELEINQKNAQRPEIYKTCIVPENCSEIVKFESDLLAIKSQYEKELNNSKAAALAIDTVKNRIKVDEWHQHLLRAPD